jgi:hypothetical protein
VLPADGTIRSTTTPRHSAWMNRSTEVEWIATGLRNTHRAKPSADEPDAGNPHVRVRGSPGRAISRGHLAASGPLRRSLRRRIAAPEKLERRLHHRTAEITENAERSVSLTEAPESGERLRDFGVHRIDHA